ncbi:Schizosaccharomyces specific protein [Schizosaccharomyces pombe]|uniref:Uncharacterized protein PB21E7.10 n=1 Tax=Schizosaccharomyces pombe (strain 972 / ATCC 24843) TaxID=284812 RepID=YP3A_SCHPO|nr:uncharacterized protein SPBPB21E7.10 [Schizosaccharomyces pombe]G2TRR8.1 RecName: Full=Uncharacterized protein PB21E7.10 [Schizosaccharomyces pombe 972h-]CCD31349.1 sequence orphan [Schizosaccharomyces pombe]|eukprot:NP_001343139.1 uncharacterized protein SPBPB21E7.10 [Schizosaccharomyces pombe]
MQKLNKSSSKGKNNIETEEAEDSAGRGSTYGFGPYGGGGFSSKSSGEEATTGDTKKLKGEVEEGTGKLLHSKKLVDKGERKESE